MKWRLGIFITLGILVILGFIFLSFYQTGGLGLVNLYINYLSQDIPDKKFGWRDFTDRGEGELVSGYFAGSRGDTVYIWTLTGIKSYQNLQGVSVYHYADVCGAVLRLSSINPEEPATESSRPSLSPEAMFNLDLWLTDAKVGDYVSVKWMSRDGQKYIIDKLYGSSNQHYPIEQLRVEQCIE